MLFRSSMAAAESDPSNVAVFLADDGQRVEVTQRLRQMQDLEWIAKTAPDCADPGRIGFLAIILYSHLSDGRRIRDPHRYNAR